MDDDLAQEIQLKVCDDLGIVNGATPSLVAAPNDQESLSPEPGSQASALPTTARIPFRLPKLFIAVLVFGLLQVSVGVYMKFLGERPLQSHQFALGHLYASPEVTPGMVAVAKRTIARGEMFTAENVSIEPKGNRTIRYPVYHPEHLWGAVAELDIVPGAIDARSVGPVTQYPWSRGEKVQCYAIVSQPIPIGSLIGGSVNYIPIRHGRVVPSGAFVFSKGDISYEVLENLTPGKVVLSSQLKKVPP